MPVVLECSVITLMCYIYITVLSFSSILSMASWRIIPPSTSESHHLTGQRMLFQNGAWLVARGVTGWLVACFRDLQHLIFGMIRKCYNKSICTTVLWTLMSCQKKLPYSWSFTGWPTVWVCSEHTFWRWFMSCLVRMKHPDQGSLKCGIAICFSFSWLDVYLQRITAWKLSVNLWKYELRKEMSGHRTHEMDRGLHQEDVQSCVS